MLKVDANVVSISKTNSLESNRTGDRKEKASNNTTALTGQRRLDSKSSRSLVADPDLNLSQSAEFTLRKQQNVPQATISVGKLESEQTPLPKEPAKHMNQPASQAFADQSKQVQEEKKQEMMIRRTPKLYEKKSSIENQQAISKMNKSLPIKKYEAVDNMVKNLAARVKDEPLPVRQLEDPKKQEQPESAKRPDD